MLAEQNEALVFIERQKAKEDRLIIRILAAGLILYSAISFLVVAGDYYLRLALYRLAELYEWNTTIMAEHLANAGDSYWSVILGVIIGFIVLYLVSRSYLPFRSYTAQSAPMRPLLFVLFICIMCSGQLFSLFFDLFLEWLLNLSGYSAASSVESATMSAVNLSALIYGCVIAPVFEELVYRGFALRLAERFGRKFAVILSALLFAVMHANIPQAFFAFYIGLLLGYVAVNYSLLWSIALHFINNAVIGELFSYLMRYTDEYTQFIVFYAFMGTCTLIALVAIVLFRKKIRAFILRYPTARGAWKKVFTSVLMLLFLAMNIIQAFMSLDVL